MKKAIVISLIMLFMIPVSANAFSWRDFFRSLFGLNTATTTTVDITSIRKDVDTAIADYQAQAKSIDKNVQTVFIPIVSSLSSEADLKTIKDSLSTANTKTTYSEKFTAVNKIYNDYYTTLKNNKVSVLLIMKLFSDEEKSAFVKNVNELSSAGEKYYELSKQSVTLSSDVYSKATNTEERTAIINEIKAETTQLTNNTNAVSSLASELKIFGTLAGIKF